MSENRAVTDVLSAWSEGEEGATNELMDLVYDELRRMADRAFNGERAGHTLQPTALVHEVYLRLNEQRESRWQSRRHFYAIAAKMMRRILVDHARKRGRKKRNDGLSPLSLDRAFESTTESNPDLIDLDRVLVELAALDTTKVSVVELHFFCGFSVAETAKILDVSAATVTRQWRAAKAWIYRELQGNLSMNPAICAPANEG